MKLFSKTSITRLEIIAFVVGMAILTFELTAARVVAPYLGDTIYTWTSIIGVILAALALGYSKGGAWADARQRYSDIKLCLVVAAALIAIVNILKDSVLSALSTQGGSLQLQAFTASVILFALPTFVLGVVSPYLARLSISDVATSGRHLSRVDAASTVGSLVGTFLTGYLLFGLFGSRNLLTFVAVGLLLASFLVPTKKYRYWQLGLLAVVILAGFFSPKPMLEGFITEVDTAYSRIIIRDVPSGDRKIRIYQTDRNGFQSGVYTDGSKDQPFAYIRGFSYASNLNPAGSRYLIIGGGAFTFPEYLANKEPQAKIDTVEIDKQLPELSRQYFNFNQPDNLKIVHEDGRTYLNQNQIKYDMIFLDAFSASVPPFQLLTREAAEQSYESLTNEGAMVVNIISAASGFKSGMIKHIYSTYKYVFGNVEVYPVQPSTGTHTQNLMLIASKQALTSSQLSGIAAANPEFGSMVQAQLKLQFNQRQVLTDDYAPVEQLAL